jgi:ubiquinone/menaquinone biosynthesis C-methylase UbiE
MSFKLDFYETHSAEFSKSRYAVWPQVRSFLEALPTGSKVLEIGCGNGKNMMVRKDLEFTGVEPSSALCVICEKRGLSVVQADAQLLPFKDETFDAVIMIAVLHHLKPDKHGQALFEIQRVLQHGGKALLTNWAVEQPDESRRKFTPGLNMVTWKGKESAPLPYWVMNKAMACDFMYELPSQLECTDLELVAGNWSFILSKKI